MFKTTGYCRGFLLKNGHCPTLANSPGIDTSSPALTWKCICKHLEVFQGVWSDFQDLPKSAMFKTMGYCPGFFLKNGHCPTLANSAGIDTNSPAMSWKCICKHLEAFQGVWNDFQDLPKSAMFKTMGYSPGFFLKNGQFPTLANSPEID